MLLDKRTCKILETALDRLNVHLLLLDETGSCVLPEEKAGRQTPLPAQLPCEVPVCLDDQTFLAIEDTPYVLLVQGEGDAVEDVIHMASALVGSLVRTEHPRMDREDAFRRAIFEQSSSAELETMAHEYKIELEKERCAILFHCINIEADIIQRFLGNILSRTSGDAILEMDKHTVVVLKSLDDSFSFKDIEQLVSAMDNTFINETNYQVIISVGEPKNHFSLLGESFREARRATEVGKMYRPDGRVFIYRRLMLERFLAEVPREMGMRFYLLMFNRRTARLFNEEMVHTIETFFENNLNLSETARQLYIHRNTLVYRLDKVQRTIGLDLRAFDDAVTFKMIMLLGKAGMDIPRSIY